MQNYKNQFFQLALRKGNLRFGEFTLKSGRLSPYFFNAGGFDDGASLGELADCYADSIIDAEVAFDMLFGPAYKGIPLAAATAVSLFSRHGRNVPYAYNRKEAKDHGEGGTTVGAPLSGKVLIIDDVISAGTSVRESLDLIRDAGATVSAVAIALDRQERGQGSLSATMELTRTHGIPCIAIATLDDLIDFLSDAGRDGKMQDTDTDQALSEQGFDLDAMRRYREKYGA